MPIRPVLLTTALLLTAVPRAEAESFNRIASFPVSANLPANADPSTETAPEIVDATADGTMLVYTDSPLGAVGMVDISDPHAPEPGGIVMVDGEPTSLVVSGDAAFVAVNTSTSFTEPSGVLKIVDLDAATVSASCALPGQPDSTALAPDGSFLAVAIENERDKELAGGALPQPPAGTVVIVPLAGGVPDCEEMIVADLTGLALIAPSDPEPEFVDVSIDNRIAVTLQENNHIVILDRSGAIVNHFPAGSVTLSGVDTRDDRAITFDSVLTAPREPDAVKWLDPGHLVTANEGDYRGGTRGFTIFDTTGRVIHDSGTAFEHAVAAAGHYPDTRSDNRGVQPEGIEVATFGDTHYFFVLAKHGSVVGVYEDRGEVTPRLVGLIPSGIGPESAVAIPERGLFVTANAVDLGGPRAHLMIYALEEGPALYPTIRAVTGEAAPIGWGALSGLVADPSEPSALYAVSDATHAGLPSIYVIDASMVPATIVTGIPVTRAGYPAQKLDLEGLANDGAGGFWLVSEGQPEQLVPSALIRVDRTGAIVEEIAFPAALRATARRHGAQHDGHHGAQGITRVGDVLWIAIQREGADDPDGEVKLVSYDTTRGAWGAVRYALERTGKGWVGVSEITAHADRVYVIERDNQVGADAAVKRLYSVPLDQMQPVPLGEDLPLVKKTLVRDLIPDLAQWNGIIAEKIDGFAIDTAGTGFFVTDNDGVNESTGETLFWSVGSIAAARTADPSVSEKAGDGEEASAATGRRRPRREKTSHEHCETALGDRYRHRHGIDHRGRRSCLLSPRTGGAGRARPVGGANVVRVLPRHRGGNAGERSCRCAVLPQPWPARRPGQRSAESRPPAPAPRHAGHAAHAARLQRP